MGIGQTLVQLRLEKQAYQKELAAYLHVSVGTISNYEQDLHAPDLDNLSLIADFYGVSTDYILGRTKYRYPLDELNEAVTEQYTFTDMINTSVELSKDSKKQLMDYVAYLAYKDSVHMQIPEQNSDKQNKSQKEQ